MLFIAAALAVIHVAVGMCGYQRTHAWLKRHSRHDEVRAASARDLQSAHGLAELAAVAGRHGAIKATCLRQSLLVYWLLRRRGLKPELRLGVRKDEGTLDAHAWIELEGHALSPTPIRHRAFNFNDRT